MRVGFFAPLSGAQASFGNDAVRGAQLAVEEINAAGGILGHPLRLLVRDTQSRPEETKEVVNRLIDDDQVAALVGEIATDRSLVAAGIAQARGIPLITPGATSEAVTATGEWIFRACYTDSFQASAMAKFARLIGVTKAAVLHDSENPYGTGLSADFEKDFVRLGGTITSVQTYRTGDRDFSVQLNAIRAGSPEVVFLPSYYAEAALIIRQARDLGFTEPFLGTDGWDSPEFLAVGGKAVENCYFAGHFSAENSRPEVDAFVQAYTKKFDSPPPPLAALAYDSIRLLAGALARAGTSEPAALREALAATRDLAGVTGMITLDEHRNPSKPVIVLRVQDGKFTYLETVSR